MIDGSSSSLLEVNDSFEPARNGFFLRTSVSAELGDVERESEEEEVLGRGRAEEDLELMERLDAPE